MSSRLRSMVFRLAGSQQIRPADGVVVLASILTALSAAYTAIYRHWLAHPALIPYIDRDWLQASVDLQIRLALPGSIAFLLAGLVARRRWPDSPLLGYAAMQYAAAVLVFASYSNGHYTDLVCAVALFGITAVGLLLFEIRIVRAAMVTFVLLVLATTVAEQAGFLRYAPLFATAPFEGGHLAGSWLLGRGGISFLILVAIALFFIAVTQRARDQEKKLQRATELIRSYVPAQLAERILSGQQSQAVRPERHKVTLFFSDVVGFTSAADQMEPEDLAAILNEYLAEMAGIAEAHGATVNQFVGDGIMIFFGAPEATDEKDGALRCVRMAKAMQDRMLELREQWFARGVQTPFSIRTGINTGVASVGDFGSEGRKTYSAIGNQTNLTARIQEACEPGGILVSHTTWALIHEQIRCRERGEITVKGLHYPVRVYEVEGDVSTGGRRAKA